MAIFISGMRCTISGRLIDSAKNAVAFPAFVANEADRLYIFNDAVVHESVFRGHALTGAVKVRLESALQNALPTNRRCRICNQLVTDPNDYLALGHLVEAQSQPLYKFNYAHYHRSCLKTWKDLPELMADLIKLNSSDAWQGAALDRLIEALRSTTS